MALGKQAKILSDAQQAFVLSYLSGTRQADRNSVMFLLSVDAGLRAKEIALLEWSMVTDAQGTLLDEIRLQDGAAKGRSGGVVYMSKRLFRALSCVVPEFERTGPVVRSRSGRGLSPQVVTNWFFLLYRSLGFEGCSSHSGRRTAITRWARKISSVGGSLNDVRRLARHSSVAMTQLYIEAGEDAMRKVVNQI